ncbi:MAG: tRNA 4-thiouridine(8) synthase ThiI [Bacteroidales bacterium]|nr:tRNA 4-thiouridine(8) synthase ThiI [Bacteroidales bacterium]
MKELLIVKYGEVMLKGDNRPFFVDKLIKNIRLVLQGTGEFSIKKGQSMLYLFPEDEADLERAATRLRLVFGINVFHRALQVEKDIEAIKKRSAEYFSTVLDRSHSFKIETRRTDKLFSYNTYQINTRLGQYIAESFPHLTVDVHQPDVTVYVSIRKEGAFLYRDKEPGPGGLPVGTGGKATVLLSGGIDSPIAAWLIARRGLNLEPVHFYSYPYTSERAKNKVIELTKKLSRYTEKLNLYVFPFTEIQEAIVENCPHDYVTIIMRRMMMKAAEKLSEKQGAQALVTGESIGQVASQTVESLSATNASVSLPVFRPLIGMDKEEIVAFARKIGTYDISVQPYDDCCTLFVPKHPQTRPKLEKIARWEQNVDFDAMIDRGLEQIEIVEAAPDYYMETER